MSELSEPTRTGSTRPSRRSDSSAAGTEPGIGASPSVEIRDVWSRTGSKYRIRAIVLLVVNVVLFAGLGTFAFWLRTGHPFAPLVRGYWPLFWQTFQPAGEDRVTLSDLLTFPISIYEVPLQIVILGLLLAALVSIPILVSILYRFPACIPFLLVVAFLAMMPWLAITLAGSCLLASVRPFRFSFRFASALLGLVLVIIYFFSASRQSATAVQLLSRPSDRIMFVAPWVLAIIASCVLFAIVLLIARFVNYRPGAIAPLLAAMFAIPVALFEAHVGRDELHYRLLEHAYGPASAHFSDRDVSKEYEEALYQAWKLHPPPKPSYEALNANQAVRWELELMVEARRRTLFGQHREAAIRACDRFLFRYPQSRYAPNALYIKARALDLRVDLAAFRSEKVIRFYDTFTAASSRHSWEKLLANRPESPMAAVALLRLALLDARERHPQRAIERLTTLLERFGNTGPARIPAGEPPVPSVARAGAFDRILTRKPPESTLKIPLESVLFEARRWLGILQANRDPLYGYAPLCGLGTDAPGDPGFGLMQLDPRDIHYVTNLEVLLKRYPDCELADNIEVEIAKATPDADTRIALLEACIGRYRAGDALPEALFRLGSAYQELERSADARRAFQRIVSEFPDSLCYPQAEARLRLLPVPGEGATE